MTGRGAWSVAGQGGTLNVGGKTAGPYYCLAVGRPWVGTLGANPDANTRAVHGGVVAIQQALNAQNNAALLVDGLFGPATYRAVTAWQTKQPPSANTGIWGGVGPDSARALFVPQIKQLVTDGWAYVVGGILNAESMWDPGAVGYIDDTDLGLAQINGPSHPDLSDAERLNPQVAIGFAHNQFLANLHYFGGDLRTAVAAYNLGQGGATTWKKAGSPAIWTPPGSTAARDVAGYIDRILTACKDI